MERLTIDELISHCDRQLNKLPSGNAMYQEHESVRAYLQMLRHYAGIGTVEEFRTLKEAEQKESNSELLNPAGEYAAIFAKTHGMSIVEAMEQPMVKARFSYFNDTGM